MNTNEALSQLGQFGRYQFFVFIISCIPVLNSGLTMMSTVFISASPDHRCLIRECDSVDNDIENFYINNTFSIPHLFHSCHRYSSLIDKQYTNNTDKCQSKWFSNHTIESCDQFIYTKREMHSTVVTEWDVVCDNSWKLPLSRSVLMIGVLLGNLFFGSFSDRFGRKALFYFTPFVCFISSLLTAFAPNLYVFTILSAITSGCIVGMSGVSFIIGIEFIGEKYRVLCANLQEVVFSSGTILLCILAYNIRDWRYLQIVISIPLAITLLYPWLFPESIRWQASNGLTKKAMVTMRRAAKWNGVILNEQAFYDKKTIDSLNSSENSLHVKHYGAIDIFKHKVIRFWAFNLFLIWMIDSMIFYGLSFQASNLGSNTYLTLMAISAVDIPANTVVTLLMLFFKRKKVLFAFQLMAGMSCISTVFIPDSSPLFTVMAIFGKSNISASYTLLYLYTAEIFPTVLRSTGLGLCTVWSRVGGIIAPYLIELTFISPKFPLILCGVLALMCCILSMNLPETYGKTLPETLEDIDIFNDLNVCNEKTKFNSFYNRKYSENEDKTQLL